MPPPRSVAVRRRWVQRHDHRPRRSLRGVCLGLARGLVIGVLAASIALPALAEDRLRVGSKRFTEAYVLAWILAIAADPARPAEVRAGLGNTAITYEALRSGAIDLYPEYLGTIDREILGNAGGSSPQALRERLAALGFGIAIPLGFNNGYALAMREGDAERLGIRRVSDLVRHPTLRAGLSNEFIGRADGWPGLSSRYGLPQRPFGLDHALGYAALADGRIDLMDIYTTDAKITELGLRVLEDDLGHFPRYDAVVLYRLDVPSRAPQAWARMTALAGTIDERAMIAMNARAEREGVPFETIARDAVQERAARARGDATQAAASAPTGDAKRGVLDKLFAPDLGRLAAQHLGLVLGSIAAALAIGVPLAVASRARPRLRAAVLATVGVLQTVPSLAMLALLIALTGAIGIVPALIALTLYALLPIVANTVAGLDGVPSGLRDAADALALTRSQRLRHVELPLAMPTIVAGVRTAGVTCVGTATIAAFIGAGGFGERIVTGLALNDAGLMLAGALPSALLAIVFERVLGRLEKQLRPPATP
jgi:osmoprotectant transport system permease protein